MASVTIDYYTPYVQSASTSSAWQMLVSLQCQYAGSYPLAQAGFIRLSGDVQDYPFYEYITCSSTAYPVEYYNTPRSSSRFNVYDYLYGSGSITEEYQGSYLLGSQIVDWIAHNIVIAAEFHNTTKIVIVDSILTA